MRRGETERRGWTELEGAETENSVSAKFKFLMWSKQKSTFEPRQ